MTRKDLMHHVILEGNIPTCTYCHQPFLIEEAEEASRHFNYRLVDVAGLGAGYYAAPAEVLGREVIRCDSAMARGQRRDIMVQVCDCGGNEEDCPDCGGSGMIALIPDPDDPDKPLAVRVNSGGLTPEELDAQGLEATHPLPRAPEERALTRASFANWLALRDTSRPEGTESS